MHFGSDALFNKCTLEVVYFVFGMFALWDWCGPGWCTLDVMHFTHGGCTLGMLHPTRTGLEVHCPLCLSNRDARRETDL